MQSPNKHTDIRHDGFIDQYLPPQITAYIKLARFDRPVGAWLTILPGFWGLSIGANEYGAKYWIYITIFVLGGFVARAAGCVINDIWDRKLDQKVERTAVRPLASGALKPPQAIVFLLILLVLGFLLLLQLPFQAVVIGCFAIIPIALYPLMKRITYWPQLFLGIVFNLSILIGYFCFQSNASAQIFTLYAAAIFFTVGYDTIYAYQDIDDDLKIGIKSTAILCRDRPKSFVAICYTAGFACLVAALPAYWIGLTVAGLHLAWQIWYWQPDNRPNSLKVFKSNVIFQAIVWFSLLIL